MRKIIKASFSLDLEGLQVLLNKYVEQIDRENHELEQDILFSVEHINVKNVEQCMRNMQRIQSVREKLAVIDFKLQSVQDIMEVLCREGEKDAKSVESVDLYNNMEVS